jgi:hypothetical protein
MTHKTVEEVLIDSPWGADLTNLEAALDAHVNSVLVGRKADLTRLLRHVVGDVLDVDDIIGLAGEIIELFISDSEPEDEFTPCPECEEVAVTHTAGPLPVCTKCDWTGWGKDGLTCPDCGSDDVDFLVNDEAVCTNGHRFTAEGV